MKHNNGLVFLWMGALVMMFIFSGCGRVEYNQYSSKDKKLSITMDYPKGWDFDEEHGAYGAYVQVIFLEPVKLGKPLRGMMAVTVKDESKTGVKPPTLEMFGKDLLNKRLAFKDAKKLSESRMAFLGFNACVMEVSYSLPESPDRTDVKYVSLQERVIFFKRGSRFYVLRYVNEKKDFGSQEKAFMHCVNTLKFKDTK